MKYNQPFGEADPDAPYVDRNTPGAVAGSKVPGSAVEDPQREIVHVIDQAGLTPDGEDTTQLWQALQRIGSGRADIPVNGWQSAPPGSPSEGDRYIVLPTGTGAFAGHDDEIAMWTGEAWVFADPVAGLQVQYYSSRQIVLRFDGAAWTEDIATTSAAARVMLAPDPFDTEDDGNALTPSDLSEVINNERQASRLDDNLLINPSFRLQQRNTAGNLLSPPDTQSLSAGQFGPDRWKGGTGGAVLNFINTPGKLLFTGRLVQILEAFSPFAGRTFTASLVVKTGSTVTLRLGAATPVVITGDDTRQAVAITVPGGHTGNLPFDIEAGAGGAVIDKTLKLEERPFATNYVERRLEQDFALCDRYCQRFTVAPYVGAASQSSRSWVPLRGVMAGPPTVDLAPISTANIASITVQLSDATFIAILLTSTSAGPAGYQGYAVLSAEIS